MLPILHQEPCYQIYPVVEVLEVPPANAPAVAPASVVENVRNTSKGENKGYKISKKHSIPIRGKGGNNKQG